MQQELKEMSLWMTFLDCKDKNADSKNKNLIN